MASGDPQVLTNDTSETDTGATPLIHSSVVTISPAGSRPVEYHRPSRNSAHYSSGTDMSLGMISTNPSHSHSTTSSPRLHLGSGQGLDRTYAPSSFRSPPLVPPMDLDSTSGMLPSRAAPVPPTASSSRRDSGGPVSPAQGYGSSSGLTSRVGTYANKTSHSSPNPSNRYSAGATTLSYHVAAMGMANANGAPPPRPTRAGTVPLGEHLPSNGISTNSNLRDPTSNDTSSNVANHAGFLSQPTPPALHHQPFSAPTNPYAAQNNVDEAKIGLGMAVPMTVVDSKDKDLPKEPKWDG